ncbi:hypothetical protein HZA75_05865 [Candidatus Roizmanbacteria bacterium]|nr:hypothetical protein [Candidatus Roizmanbacteria bacterium]
MVEKIGETQIRIIEVFGSRGLPSCGMTDAGSLGQGTSETEYIGGCKEEIKPGTPRWMFPISLLYRWIPGRLSKSPRNMQDFNEKHKRG